MKEEKLICSKYEYKDSKREDLMLKEQFVFLDSSDFRKAIVKRLS